MDLERSRAARFVDWTLKHGRLLWIVAVVLAVPAAARTGWLYAHLKSDLEELLPRESPSVAALDEFRARVGGRQFLGVVVDTGTPEHVPDGERLVDDLAARVRAYPSDLVAAVRIGNGEERAFLDRHGPLYLDVADLQTVRARVEARRDYEVTKASGALLDDDDTDDEAKRARAPSVDFSDIEAKYKSRYGIGTSKGESRYTSTEKHLTVLLIELGGFSSGAGHAQKVYDRVRADVETLGGPDHYAPGMRVGYAGDATIAVEEMSALVADLSISSVVVLFAVIATIILYYRWWRSVFIVMAPLLLAAVYSFGVASLPPFGVQAVNSNTAFLGSIIVGNGINFGLILLARYVEERRLGVDVRTSLIRAVEGSRGGTLAAAAAAGASYASLAVTQFRGFRQFGVIGGLGMAFAWVTAFVLIPPLVKWVDRDDTTRPSAKPQRTAISFWVTRAVAKSPALVCAATLVFTTVALVEVASFRASDVETDFSKLRRRDTWTIGEGYWGAKMNAVLGEYLTPFVFLADTPEDARALAARLRTEMDTPPFKGSIASIRTLEDVVPSQQAEKLTILEAIKEDLTPVVRASLTPDQRAYVERLVGGEAGAAAGTVGLDDLPRTFTLGLRERDGSTGRIVLVTPTLTGPWWDANAIRAFVDGLRRVAQETTSSARAPRLAGSLPLSSDIVQAIRHDGPIASGAAFVAVVAIVLVLLRRSRASLYVTGALVIGVLWLWGASRLLQIHINFANFIAFPITFGIGVDYAVNVVSRYENDGAVDILAAVRSTGAAVALCSVTTIIGYSSLLMAENQALFLFGLLAVLGEVACLTVALVSLPALILLLQRHRTPATAIEGSGSGNLSIPTAPGSEGAPR